MLQKSLRILALIAITFTITNIQAQNNRGKERHEDLSRELNLSPRQADDMKALHEESFIQKNRMKDKMKAEHRAFRDNHDKKLRSILDEKQYYAYKNKMKEQRKHKIKKHRNKMNGGQRNPQGRGQRNHDRF